MLDQELLTDWVPGDETEEVGRAKIIYGKLLWLNFIQKAWQNLQMIWLGDIGSQKIYSDSTVGMDQNGANPEPERAIMKLLYSTRKEVLSSRTMEVTVGMDRRVTIGESFGPSIYPFVILLSKHKKQ